MCAAESRVEITRRMLRNQINIILGENKYFFLSISFCSSGFLDFVNKLQSYSIYLMDHLRDQLGDEERGMKTDRNEEWDKTKFHLSTGKTHFKCHIALSPKNIFQ